MSRTLTHHALGRLMAWRRPKDRLYRLRALHTVYRYLYGRPIHEYGELVVLHHMLMRRRRA